MSSTSADRVKKWRKHIKDTMVGIKGGCCSVCGYDKYYGALHFHHVDMSEKSFSFSQAIANPKNINALATELNKCVLVCNRCHSEIHAGLTECPPLITQVESDIVELLRGRVKKYNNCKVCNASINSWQHTCSRSCAGLSRRKVDWDSVDLVTELKTKSLCQIGRELNCSDNAVRRRAKKLNLLN